MEVNIVLRNILYKLSFVWVCVLMCLVTPAFAVQISDPYTSEVENTQIGDDVDGLSVKNKFNHLNKNSYPNNKTKLITRFKEVNNLKQVKNIIFKSGINNELINSSVNTELVNPSVNSNNTTNIYRVYNVTRSKTRYNASGCLDELNTLYTSTYDSINKITVEIRELKSNITSINNEINEIDEKLANHIVTVDEDPLYLTELKEKRAELQESQEKLLNNKNKLEKLNNLLENKKNQLNTCKNSLNNLENTEDKKTVIEDYNNYLKTINQINNQIKETNKQSMETNTKITPIETTENNEIITTETKPNNPEPTTNNNSTIDKEIITTTNDEPPTILIAPANDYSTTLYSTWGTAAGLTITSLGIILGPKLWQIHQKALLEQTLFTHITDAIANGIPIGERATNGLVLSNKFITSTMQEVGHVTLPINSNVLSEEIRSYEALITNLRKTAKGNALFLSEMETLGMDSTGSSVQIARRLVYVGSKDTTIGVDMIDTAVGFTKIKTANDIELCKTCKNVLYTSRVFSVLSLVMDIYTVASIVSWAGKEFGWWKKDYVNDYTIGLLFSLF